MAYYTADKLKVEVIADNLKRILMRNLLSFETCFYWMKQNDENVAKMATNETDYVLYIIVL